MSAPAPRKSRPRAKPVRIVSAHIKLVAAVALGVVLFLAIPVEPQITRALLAWNVAVGLYLAVAAYFVGQFDLGRVRQRAAEEDEGGALVLALTVAAAIASLAAIFVELGNASGKGAGALSITLALSTVVLSWFFIQIIFAFHYAHEFYGEDKDGHKGGLKFPDDDQPEYWDFVYFAFVIGMTFQVSDVQVTSKSIRRLVIAHGVVSFFYNVAVLSLMVNIGGEFLKR
jgi:uncharacterized membrane protein